MRIMKKFKALLVGCLVAAFSAGSAMAAEGTAPNCGKVGLGYQGVLAGDVLQGFSARYWAADDIAVEGNFFYGNATVGIESSDEDLFDGSLYLFTGKVMYAPVVNSNSRFYVGLEGGIGAVDVEDADADVDVYVLNPLIGAEHYFSEFPELGFNWEVGYKMHMISAGPEDFDDDDLEIDLSGISVALGAHYYF